MAFMAFMAFIAFMAFMAFITFMAFMDFMAFMLGAILELAMAGTAGLGLFTWLGPHLVTWHKMG